MRLFNPYRAARSYRAKAKLAERRKRDREVIEGMLDRLNNPGRGTPTHEVHLREPEKKWTEKEIREAMDEAMAGASADPVEGYEPGEPLSEVDFVTPSTEEGRVVGIRRIGKAPGPDPLALDAAYRRGFDAGYAQATADHGGEARAL